MISDALKTNSGMLSVSLGNNGLCLCCGCVVVTVSALLHNGMKCSWKERGRRTQIHADGQHHIIPLIPAGSAAPSSSIGVYSMCFISLFCVQGKMLEMMVQLQSLMH